MYVVSDNPGLWVWKKKRLNHTDIDILIESDRSKLYRSVRDLVPDEETDRFTRAIMLVSMVGDCTERNGGMRKGKKRRKGRSRFPLFLSVSGDACLSPKRISAV